MTERLGIVGTWAPFAEMGAVNVGVVKMAGQATSLVAHEAAIETAEIVGHTTDIDRERGATVSDDFVGSPSIDWLAIQVITWARMRKPWKKRLARVAGGMLLGTGQFVAFDDEDWLDIEPHWWWAQVEANTTYVAGVVDESRVRLHRHLLGLTRDDPSVDHIDRNGLNNRRANLRLASQQKQNVNQRRRGGASKYRGVSWHNHNGMWQAQIEVAGRGRHLGYFRTEDEAAATYDQTALDLGWHEAVNNTQRTAV